MEGAWIDFEELVQQCSEWQLEILLSREDVNLEKIRKKLFFDTKTTDAIKWSAIHFHFYPTYEEFDKILSKYTRKKKIKERKYQKIQLLGDIGRASTSLNLCMYQAILDLIEDENNCDEYVSDDRSRTIIHMENKIKSLRREERQKEIIDLRLFNLASYVCRTDSFPYDDEYVLFLDNYVVPNNSWRTFMAFASVWPKGRNEEIYRRNNWLRENTDINIEIEDYEEGHEKRPNEIDEVKEKLSNLEDVIKDKKEWLLFGVGFILLCLDWTKAAGLLIAVLVFKWFSKPENKKLFFEKTPRLLKRFFIFLLFLFYIWDIFIKKI